LGGCTEFYLFHFFFLPGKYKTDRNRSLKWFATAFLAAIIPTGTFFFDKKLKEEEKISSSQAG
jgi:hypothetical protein